MTRTPTRNVLIAYGVGALALLLIFVLTQEPVVLVVLGVVAVVGILQLFFISRGGNANEMVHDHARAESAARYGNMPPERRGNF